MKDISNFLAISLLILFVSIPGQARVFNFSSESIGAYFNATGQSSLLDRDPFVNSSGANTQFSNNGFEYHPGFELGVVSILSKGFTITTSLQILKSDLYPRNFVGFDSGGTKLLDVTSSVFALNPKISFEFDMSNKGTTRSYMHFGVGYADITIDQAYTLTAAGQSTYSFSASEYVEKLRTYGLSYTVGLGYEFLAIDNVTLNLEAGYRVLPLADLTYKAAYSELLTQPGSAQAGDSALDNNGKKRSMEFGGGYIGVGFRFYINTL
ncbi:MAG: hypothetical protein KDD50_06090 [Bdellovibrionales bacterium]|nr:hypothetical protein [Bdellovibrionales bacterium]